MTDELGSKQRRLHFTEFDVVVLGAGINGCSVARTLTSQGKKVLVVDKGAVASGTSAKSSRLIHGGLRYLEYGHFSMVRKSLRDRNRLVSEFPDLVRLTPFILPVYSFNKRKRWQISIGLSLYRALDDVSWKPYQLSAKELQLNTAQLIKDKPYSLYSYPDGVTDDQALTKAILSEAVHNGAQVLEHTSPKSLQFGTKCSIELPQGTVTTKAIVNATGPWVNETCTSLGLPTNFSIRKVGGTHLQLNRLLCPYPCILEAADGRPFFIVPDSSSNTTYTGTTEFDTTLPCDDVIAPTSDEEYLLNSVNRYLARPLEQSNILSSWVGVRPLLLAGQVSSNAQSREHMLEKLSIGPSTLINIYGGKLSTCLTLAEEVESLLR